MTNALQLMLTGMGTVFFILIMVVVLGNVIIRITNSFATVSTQAIAPAAAPSGMEASKLAAIVSAVDVVTRGKGKVTSVEKIDE
ncbi:OadG family protein [Maribellus sp. YY47]|uniref:OadG family protein n=1 Tax=Maribellus sp. YY47 TaxID=2929486 RepID=UPI0020010D18|nr:OadG family protein [Maribellus sp. YY47]MCK3683228.1 OadG family protein [Maribellus sp. YY47]